MTTPTPLSTLLAATLLLGCHSSTPTEPTATANSTPAKTTPVTDSCQVLTPAEITAVLAMPIDPGQHVLKTSTIMCGWAKPGVTNDSEVVLNFTTPDYFEKERDPHPRIAMTPAPGIGDDAYYITSQLGTSLFIKKGNTVIGFTIRDKTIPSAQLMEKERALGLRKPPPVFSCANRSLHLTGLQQTLDIPLPMEHPNHANLAL